MMMLLKCCGGVCGGGDEGAVIEKLVIEKTNCVHVDGLFEQAVAPFNNTVDTVWNFQKGANNFKTIAGVKTTATLKDALISLKKIYPNIELQVGGKLDFTLVPGKAKISDAASEAKATQLIESFDVMGDLAEDILNLTTEATKAAENIFNDVRDMREEMKNEEISIMGVIDGTIIVISNIKEFRKVADIELAMLDMMHNFSSEVADASNMMGIDVPSVVAVAPLPTKIKDAVTAGDTAAANGAETAKDTAGTTADSAAPNTGDATEMTKLLD